jgi:predicted nucleic acid-binding protein
VKNKADTLFFKFLQSDYQLHISILTHAELFSGKSVWEHKQLYDELKVLCSTLHVDTIDRLISINAGKLRAYNKIEIADALIAATAIHYDYQLVTLNIKDFKDIEKLKLWKAE